MQLLLLIIANKNYGKLKGNKMNKGELVSFKENELTGKSVICAFPILHDHEDWKQKFEDEHVSYTQDDDKYFIEGIVSGDTKNLGLSVVAIENPKWCLLQLFPGNWDDVFGIRKKIRLNIKQGYLNCWIKNTVIPAYPLLCPY